MSLLLRRIEASFIIWLEEQILDDLVIGWLAQMTAKY